jgi:hypothetical protein
MHLSGGALFDAPQEYDRDVPLRKTVILYESC